MTIGLVFWVLLGALAVVIAAIAREQWGQTVTGIGWAEIGFTNMVMFMSAIIGGLSGFGGGQVAAGVLPLFIPAATASVLFTPLAIITSGTTFLSVRTHFKPKDYLFPALGLLPTLPIGAYFFSQWNDAQVREAIGVLLLFAVVAIALVRQLNVVQSWIESTGFKPGWKLGLSAGAMAGLLGGAVAIPGPPMVVYGSTMMAAGFWTPTRTKAVFTSVFCTIMAYRLITLIVLGKVTLPLMIVSALAIPGVALGVLSGIILFNRMSSSTFTWVVLTLLATNALLLILFGQSG